MLEVRVGHPPPWLSAGSEGGGGEWIVPPECDPPTRVQVQAKPFPLTSPPPLPHSIVSNPTPLSSSPLPRPYVRVTVAAPGQPAVDKQPPPPEIKERPMSTTEAPATRPDLSSLPWETRVNAVLAELVDGGFWKQEDGAWWMQRQTVPNSFAHLWYVDASGLPGWTGPFFSDYLNDPAAAWGLMVREGVSLVAPEPDIPTWCGWASGAGSTEHTEPAHVVALAVLHKYAADPRWADLIHPLLAEAPKEVVAGGKVLDAGARQE